MSGRWRGGTEISRRRLSGFLCKNLRRLRIRAFPARAGRVRFAQGHLRWPPVDGGGVPAGLCRRYPAWLAQAGAGGRAFAFGNRAAPSDSRAAAQRSPAVSSAAEFQFLTPTLAFWEAYEPSVKCDLSCCARMFGKEIIFIDPIPLADAALAELVAGRTPAGIILTNGNHARAAAEFRDQFSIPILAHAAAVGELAVAVDGVLAEGGRALGHLEVMEIPGAPAGEIALHAGNVVHVGDALIHLEPQGFSLLPEKYCADAREMRRALGKLLRFNFEVLTFAHGLPLVARARHRLESLLA